MLKTVLSGAQHGRGSGITFKENCPDIRNSKVADLVRELEHWGAKVVVADPWANPDEVFPRIRHPFGNDRLRESR